MAAGVRVFMIFVVSFIVVHLLRAGILPLSTAPQSPLIFPVSIY
jgi:hypothetical protein